jgi:hypothetical protein
VGFINVYLNGVLLGSADYTASNGTTVVLATGASAGNLVTVESFQISSVANAISNSAGAINLAGTLISGVLPVANGGTGVTTSTGTGSVVLSAAPTLTGQATIPTINLTGGQIAFPATQNPSSDANTLDDYEEGTWTPSIGGNATYGTTWGLYTKIGNIVNCQFRVTISSKGTGNNNIVNGLPFAVASGSGSAGEAQSGSVAYFESLASSFVFLGLYGSVSSVNFTTLTAANGTTGQATVWQNSSIIYGQITYRVA